MLRLDLRPGEGVDIDQGRVVIRLESKSGQTARVAIEANESVKIRHVTDVPTPAQLAQKGLSRPD